MNTPKPPNVLEMLEQLSKDWQVEISTTNGTTEITLSREDGVWRCHASVFVVAVVRAFNGKVQRVR